MIGSFHCRRAKPPLGAVLIINLLGKGLTPRACMGDVGFYSLAPASTNTLPVISTIGFFSCSLSERLVLTPLIKLVLQKF